MNVFPSMTVTTDSLVAFFIAIPPYEYKHPSDTKYNHPKTRNSDQVNELNQAAKPIFSELY